MFIPFRKFPVIAAMTVAVLIVGSGAALQVATAQQNGLTRTDLQQHDLSIPGHEASRCASALRRA